MGKINKCMIFLGKGEGGWGDDDESRWQMVCRGKLNVVTMRKIERERGRREMS
jgi:hypothetical protein